VRRRLVKDPRPPRSLRRDDDGTLYDLDERRTITITELAEDVRVGRRFKARQQGSERNCTQQVLLQVLAAAGPAKAPSLPGAGGQLHGLAGAVGAIAGAIADRRDGASADGDRDRGILGRGRSANGTGHKPRPRITIDEEESRA
jgi:hypothetical protein